MAARGDAADGDWLIAERQTAGRGRMGRSWESPAGNFYGSTLIALRPTDPPAPSLSLAIGYGVWMAVGRPATLKWPNDLMIGQAKVAGVLLERQGHDLVAGMGINLAAAPQIEGRETIALSGDGRALIAVADVLDRLASTIPHSVSIWREQGVTAITHMWQSAALAVGTPLATTLPDGTPVNGQFDGLDESGALRLRLADGDVRVIHAGDVFLI